jgi:hypothetical protein
VICRREGIIVNAFHLVMKAKLKIQSEKHWLHMLESSNALTQTFPA